MYARIGDNVKVHHTVRSYGRNAIGDDSMILDNVILGFPSTNLLLELRQVDLNLEHADYEGCSIDHNAVIRSDVVIYCSVTIGHDVRTGHRVLVREKSRKYVERHHDSRVVAERLVSIYRDLLGQPSEQPAEKWPRLPPEPVPVSDPHDS